MSARQQGRQLFIWSMALVGLCLSMMFTKDIMFHILSQVSWTGVGTTTIIEILNAIVNGLSIGSAVMAVVGAILAGPITAVLELIGRQVLISYIKKYGIRTVAAW